MSAGNASGRAVVVAEAGEIARGEVKIVHVDGRSIGVFNVDGEYFAVRNSCPHAGGPLCEGVRSGLVLSDGPGHYTYVRRGEVLRCPWHQWEFDIRTGKSWFDPAKVRVARYEARLERGADLLSSRDAELVRAGMRQGPYTVETYPVEESGEYVVIQL